MNLLLDADIVIDYLGKQPPHYEAAEKVVAMGFFGDATLWAPAQSFRDAFSALVRYADSAKVQGAMLQLLDVVNPVDLTSNDIAAAARMQWDSFNDCLVAVSAAKAKADYLVTRNVAAFTRSPVPAITPADLLAHVRETKNITYESVELDGSTVWGQSPICTFPQ